MLDSITLQRLARICLARGNTTKRLGSRIGLSQSAVSRLAAGRVTNINAMAASRLLVEAGGHIELPVDFADSDGAPPIPAAEVADAA